MKNNKFAVLNPSILEEFIQWGKPSIEINEMTHLTLHIEGIYDRFSIDIYPSGKTYLNTKYFKRCTGQSGIGLHIFKDTLVELFDTECYEIDEETNRFIAV